MVTISKKSIAEPIETIPEIVEKIEYAIEQHPSFLKVIPQDILEEKERLNKEFRY